LGEKSTNRKKWGQLAKVPSTRLTAREKGMIKKRKGSMPGGRESKNCANNGKNRFNGGKGGGKSNWGIGSYTSLWGRDGEEVKSGTIGEEKRGSKNC